MSEIGTKFLTEAEKRLEELQPMVQEFNDLSEEVTRFKGEHAPEPEPERNGSTATATRPRRGRRPEGEPSRQDQVESLIKESGSNGVSIGEMQEKLGLTYPNYLYRITAKLESERRIKKMGKNFVAA